MSKKTQTQCIVAAAFQQHLVKSLSLDDDLRPKKAPISRAAKSRVKKITSVVDTGRGNVKSRPKVERSPQEYVLDKQPEPSTLAQKLGLVEGPTPLMTENQWDEVKVKSHTRNDSRQPCVICKDNFGLQQQVILSCSHVFHRNCLEAFERFTGKKSCPLCRKEQYQKRVIYEGAIQHRHHCATIIQATWRGYVVRSWYVKLRRSVPPKEPLLRKKFFEEKLSAITDRMVASCSTQVDVLLREADSNIAASRHVFDRFNNAFSKLTYEQWAHIQIKALMRDDKDCPICLNRLCPSQKTNNLTNKKPENNETSQTSNIDKNSNKNQYGVDSHSIISMGNSNSESHKRHNPSNNNPQNDKIATETTAKNTVLLSCSHVFHKVCIDTFEELIVDTTHQCPVCRDVYQKLVL